MFVKLIFRPILTLSVAVELFACAYLMYRLSPILNEGDICSLYVIIKIIDGNYSSNVLRYLSRPGRWHDNIEYRDDIILDDYDIENFSNYHRLIVVSEIHDGNKNFAIKNIYQRLQKIKQNRTTTVVSRLVSQRNLFRRIKCWGLNGVFDPTKCRQCLPLTV